MLLKGENIPDKISNFYFANTYKDRTGKLQIALEKVNNHKKLTNHKCTVHPLELEHRKPTYYLSAIVNIHETSEVDSKT